MKKRIVVTSLITSIHNKNLIVVFFYNEATPASHLTCVVFENVAHDIRDQWLGVS